MKAVAHSFAEAPIAEKGWLAVYADLIKARLTFLVLATTAVGFYMGVRGAMDYALMFHTVLGTALVASGAAALNQLLEREHDARMTRTAGRPLPSGRLQPQTVLLFGGMTAGVGLIYLAFAVNAATSLLGAFTLATYLFVYTPLKRTTWLNTSIGAIPGALPPLMGWAAARNDLGLEGWALFAILFFWQLPHFMAIAWMYREEYARAGFVMISSVDTDGSRTGRYALSHTLGLLPVSLSPYILKLAGTLYLAGALALGFLFLGCAIHFSRKLTVASARRLFYASILYLPLLLALMAWDKLK